MSGYSNSQLDGDASGKTLDSGATAGSMHSDLADGLHETAANTAGAGSKTSGTGTSVFDKTGAVGKQFNADGAIGGTAQAVGGPFDKDGAIGKHFNAGGTVGGSVQEHLGGAAKQ